MYLCCFCLFVAANMHSNRKQRSQQYDIQMQPSEGLHCTEITALVPIYLPLACSITGLVPIRHLLTCLVQEVPRIL